VSGISERDGCLPLESDVKAGWLKGVLLALPAGCGVFAVGRMVMLFCCGVGIDG